MGREPLTGPATSWIASELRAQRARNNWTLDDIAKRSNLSRSTVDRALKGNTALSVEVLIKLCIGMNLDIKQIVNEAQTRLHT